MLLLHQEYSGHAEGESDLKLMCQPGELQKSSWESTIAAAIVLEASVVRRARM